MGSASKEWVVSECRFAGLRQWNVEGIAQSVLEDARREAAEAGKDPQEWWDDQYDYLLQGARHSLQSRGEAPGVIRVVLERVKEKVDEMLARNFENPA